MAMQQDPMHLLWLDYLTAHPPKCPTRSSHLLPNVEETHEAGKSSRELCIYPLVLVKRTVLDRKNLADIEKYMALPHMKVSVCSVECIQPLYNEQGVAEVFFYNVLVPVKNALALVLKNSWNYPGLEQQVEYKIEIRAQQVNTTDNGRCDHYIVLEPVIKGQPIHVAPPKSPIWLSVERFKTRMLEIQTTMSGGPQSKVDYPSMVLCVIEEKKPHVLDYDAWSPGYLNQTSTGQRNVAKICPQIRKYAADSECPLVMLTDYVTNLLISFMETGIKKVGLNLLSIQVTPMASIYKLSDESPRYNLFCAGMQRLIDAKAIRLTDSA